MSAAKLYSSVQVASCSGRSLLNIHVMQRNTHSCKRFVTSRRLPSSLPVVVVQALYNFTDSSEVRIPGQRRNRGLLKKEAREVMAVVRGLTSMSSKQLAAVSRLLPPGTMEAVEIAARLPRSNQGRKRQEGLVAKLLRVELTEQQLNKLEEAVTADTEHGGIYDDSDVSSLVEVWTEGLLATEKEVEEELFGYPAAWGPENQQLRALVRQCQQALEEERELAAARLQKEGYPGDMEAQAGGSSSSISADSRSDSDRESNGDEDEAVVLAEAAARAGGGKRRWHRKVKVPEPRDRALVRSLRKMLRPLAARVVQEGLA